MTIKKRTRILTEHNSDGTHTETSLTALLDHQLIWDETISGSAVTSVTTNGTVTLDGNAHGGYWFEIIIENTSGSATQYYLYFNNDQTSTNYYQHGQHSNSSGADAYNNNTAELIPNGRTVTIGGYAMTTGMIMITPAGRTSYNNNGHYNDTGAGGVLHNVQVVRKTATVTNLTRIDVVASVASAIGVDSQFRLWRRI